MIRCISGHSFFLITEKSLVLKNFRVNESKIHVIPNGINKEEFDGIDKIKERKDNSLKKILFVGRIEKYKGLDYVVRALKYLPENFILEVVGKGSYKSRIVKLAEELGVIDRIEFYQDLSREELIRKYAEAVFSFYFQNTKLMALSLQKPWRAKRHALLQKLLHWLNGSMIRTFSA